MPHRRTSTKVKMKMCPKPHMNGKLHKPEALKNRGGVRG